MKPLVVCDSLFDLLFLLFDFCIFLLFLLFLQDGQMTLVKNSALEDVDAQNLEVVVFCEDVAA